MQGLSEGPTKNEIKALKSLLTKKGRTDQGRFSAEGVRLLEESIHHGWYPESVYCVEEGLHERALKLLDEYRKLKISVKPVSEKIFQQITDTETSQGVLGVFGMNKYAGIEFSHMKYKNYLLLDNLADPGNVGTLIRSALAFKFDMVLLGPKSVEAFNPKVVRSTAGAFFGIPVIEVDYYQITKLKKGRQIPYVAAHLEGVTVSEGINSIKGKGGVVLAVGAEAFGVGKRIKNLTDIRIRIDHSGKVESLNAAVAGSILMNEIYRGIISTSR